MVVIIDYNMGNLGSLYNMLHNINVKCVISSDEEVIFAAEKIILPGVGAFDNAMTNIRKMHLEDVLNKKVLELNTPVLGICLGMQIMAKRSEEGIFEGLGWFEADVRRFNFDNVALNGKRFSIPHMGWAELQIKQQNGFIEDLDPKAMFYFVHSYYIHCHESKDILATSNYGIEFTSAVAKDNIIGVQFHPEKSLRYGKKLLMNFCKDKQLP